QIGSPGAFKNLCDIDACEAMSVHVDAAVAHQATVHCKYAERVDRWNPIARRQCHESIAIAGEHHTGIDEKRVGTPLGKPGESRFELGLAASFHNDDPTPERVRRRLYVLHLACDRRPWINNVANRLGLRSEFAEKFKPLPCKLPEDGAYAREVTARLVQAG